MLTTLNLRLASVLGVFCLFLYACGGGGGGGSAPAATPPGEPRALEINVGDGAVSLGWIAPLSDGGASIQSYVVNVFPSVNPANIRVSGQSAVVSGLSNGAIHAFSVAARNAAGQGQASAQVEASPTAANSSSYTAISITGDTSPSGIFDPSVVRISDTEIWMAYSGVDYYRNPPVSGPLVQDVSTKIARSGDGGNTFAYVATLGAAQAATVTDTIGTVCGAATCTGRWVYETPWLIHDSTDSNADRRWKLFAHKYFLYPPGPATTVYVLGAVVMWTAPTPGGAWSAEQMVLGWNLTPPELAAPNNVNTINPALANCLVVAEGGVSVRGGALDFVFSCPYSLPGANPLPQKIVLLRSTDHAVSFQYVSTLLNPADAPPGSAFFTAPSLVPTQSNAPVLIVTPTTSAGVYAGCMVIPFADEGQGTLMRDAGTGLPVSILTIPRVNASHFGGACAWDRGLNAPGIFLNDVDLSAAPLMFTILATKKPL